MKAIDIRDWDDTSFASFYKSPLSAARGAVTVPAGQDLGVELDQRHPGALSTYADLPANALQAIHINERYGFEPGELEFISHMKGLVYLKIIRAGREDLDFTRPKPRRP